MKRFLFCLFSVLPFLAAAQSNFREGYVVTNTNDTLKGYINYRERSVNPVSVQFRPVPESKTQVFFLKNSSSYRINDLEKFQRFTVDISMDNVNIPNLPVGPDSSSKRETVFMKVIQEGRYLTLYSYRDDIKNRFYIKDKNSAVPEELIYQRFMDPDNIGKVITRGKFAGQLMDVLLKYNAGTTADTEKLRHLNYNEEDLLKISSLINGKQVLKSKSQRIRFFTGTGLSISHAAYKGNNDLANSAAKSKTSVLPILTAGIDLFANPAIGKLIYRAELSFLMSRNDISTTTDTEALAALSHTFDQYTVALIPQLIYNVYNTAALRIFVGAGFGMNFSTYGNNSSSRYNSFRDETTVVENQIEFESFSATFPLRIGTVINKSIELSAIYTPNSSVTNYNSFNIGIQRYSLGLNYLFGK
jgi:hypothetical protein